jgi:hypothetical protein
MGEAIASGLLSLILYLAAAAVPFAGLMIPFVAPLSLILLSIRRGVGAGVMGLLVLFLLMGIWFPLPGTTSPMLEFGVMALALGEGIRRGWKSERTVFLATLAAGVGMSLLLLLETLRLGVSLLSFLDQQVGIRLQELREVVAKTHLPLVSWEALEGFLLRSYPALIFLSILLVALINYYLARYLRGLNNPEARREDLPFSSWSIPEQWIWGFILSLFLYLLPEPYKRTGLNLLLVFGGLYLSQGMAISSSLFQRWRVSSPFKVLLYLLFFSQPFLLLLLALMGLSDVWLNFRKWTNAVASDRG